MSASTNLCTFTGNVVRDPETRVISSGKSVTSFSLAITNGWGERKTTMYLNVSAWEKLGSIVQQYATKGSKILVSGSLESRKYTNKEGIEKEAFQITANHVELLGGKPGGITHNAPEPYVGDPANIPF